MPVKRKRCIEECSIDGLDDVEDLAAAAAARPQIEPDQMLEAARFLRAPVARLDLGDVEIGTGCSFRHIVEDGGTEEHRDFGCGKKMAPQRRLQVEGGV